MHQQACAAGATLADMRCRLSAVAPTCLAPQALCFLEAGRTYVPAKPWAPAEESKWVADARLLPPPVLQLLERFAAQAAEGGGDSGSAAAAS